MNKNKKNIKNKRFAEWGDMWKMYDELKPIQTNQMQQLPVDNGMQNFQPQQTQVNPFQPQVDQEPTQANNSTNNIGNGLQSIAKGAGQTLNSFMVGAPQLINALLPDQQLEREDRTLPRALNQYPQGIQNSQAIYQDGGKVKKLISGQPFSYNERYEEEKIGDNQYKRKPIYTNNPNDPRLQSYNDSLNLYKATEMQSILMQGPSDTSKKPNKPFEWSINASKQRKGSKDFATEKEFRNSRFVDNKDKQLLDFYKTLNFNFPTAIMYHGSPDLVNDTIKPQEDYFDGRAWSPRYKKPVQPVLLNQNPPLEQMNTQSMEQFPVDIEQREFNKVGRNVSTPYSYERGSGLGMRRESGFRPEYKEYENGGEIVARNGYSERKKRKGNIQVTEEIPLQDINSYVNNAQPQQNTQPFPVTQSQYNPQLVPLPEQKKKIQFEKLLDRQGNAQYSPIFSGNYTRHEAEQAMQQLPEFFGEIPVLRSPELYRDVMQGFDQFSQGYDWKRSMFKNGGKVYKEGEELDLSLEEIQALINQGYEIDY